MIIKIVFDNQKTHEAFQKGWGFSCFIDMGLHKILFDTGVDLNAFFSNHQRFNIRWEEITEVMFSHKHADHIAGWQEIITKLSKNCRLFLPYKFHSKIQDFSIHTEVVKDFKEIAFGVYSLVLKAGFFLYEQALILETQQGIVVITGCAHFGIANLLHKIQKRLKQPIYLVLGGFHLFRKNQKQVSKITHQLKDLKVQCVAPCHCSGNFAIDQFRHDFQEGFYSIGAGTILTLDNDHIHMSN